MVRVPIQTRIYFEIIMFLLYLIFEVVNRVTRTFLNVSK